MNHEIYPGLSSPHLKELFSERELQIMEAALEVFTEKGYQASSTREIADRAGIAEGTIFRYFKTKKDLLYRLSIALFEKFLAPLILSSIEEIFMQSQEQSLEEVLGRLIRDRLALIRANIRYVRLFFYEMQLHEDFRDKFFTEIIKKATSLAIEYFDGKQKAGLIRADVDSRAIVFSLVGMVGSFILWHEFFKDENISYSDDEIVTQVTQILLHGIQND